MCESARQWARAAVPLLLFRSDLHFMLFVSCSRSSTTSGLSDEARRHAAFLRVLVCPIVLSGSCCIVRKGFFFVCLLVQVLPGAAVFLRNPIYLCSQNACNVMVAVLGRLL